MNIKNDQITRISRAIDLLATKATTRKEKLVLKAALSALDELEIQRSKLNSRSATFIAKKRSSDPLYGRTNEYKQKRIEKAKKILALYGSEVNANDNKLGSI